MDEYELKLEDDSDEGVRMPFGKHKGELLEEIPSDYLRWVVDNVEGKDWLVDAAQEELDYRDE